MAGEQRAGLAVTFIQSLDAAVDDVVAYLNDGVENRGLLDIDHVVVPNAGVRSWLLHMLSTRIGVGSRGNDGVAMGVSVNFIGELDRLIGRPDMGTDPWSVGPLAVSLLSVIDDEDASWSPHATRLGGGLRAARLMADRFDRYHTRRPSMILEWEDGRPALALQHDPRVVGSDQGIAAPALESGDVWQFELWRAVRAVIGAEPWPVVLRRLKADPSKLDELHLPPRLLLLGHQSLSVHHLELLELLSTRMQIQVMLQHPSPDLARRWAVDGNVEVTPGVAPTATRVAVDSTIDELVGMWLRGSMEAQTLLRSQGIQALVPDVVEELVPANLLAAIQQTVRTGRTSRFRHSVGDPSLRIHRAHNLSRQVEIVHDAILHAFADDPALRPQDVAILCADIKKASPLLTATFGRRITTSGSEVEIPLTVADRGLREIDDGARLLADVVVAVTGRFSVGDVMSVVTNNLVCKRFEVTDGDIDAWNRYIDRGRVRWGISAAQRDSIDPGLDLDLDAHTWSAALNSALLGAMLTEAPERVEFGRIVPMTGLEPADIGPVSKLLAIIGILSALHASIISMRGQTIVGWTDLLEEALVELVGDETDVIDDARAFLNTMREHVSSSAVSGLEGLTVTFAHFAEQLQERIDGNPGRQSLLTGAVLATSLVPLRGVPFKVVCLVGFDEGSLSAGESEGDDLLARQQFVGDPDQRLEDRRAILDAICAASSRVIITCNGRSIKNNEKVPLITPLAELVDLCERCGATKVDKKSTVEFMHPRHFSGRANFELGGIVPGMVWAHDRAALGAVDAKTDSESEAVKHARSAAARPASARADDVASPADEVKLTIKELSWFLKDPLDAFVKGGLGINTFRSESGDVPASIPLELDESEFYSLCRSRAAAHAAGLTPAEWKTVVRQSAVVPPGKFGTAVTKRAENRFAEYQTLAEAWNFRDSPRVAQDVDIVAAGIRLVGKIHYRRSTDGRMVLDVFDADSTRLLDQNMTALLLLIAKAMGADVTGGLVCLFGESRTTDSATGIVTKSEITIGYEVVFGSGVDQHEALKRVSAMLGLYAEARTTPFTTFRDTGQLAVQSVKKNDDADKRARKAFANRVAGPRRKGSSPFAHSTECLVFGPLPSYDDIFAPKGSNLKFLTRFFAAVLKADDAMAKSLGMDPTTSPPTVPHGKPPIKKRKRYFYP